MPKNQYKVEFAPDGEHFQGAKKGDWKKMWDYFTRSPEIAKQLSANPFAKFRLIGESGKIIGTRPKGK